MKLDEKALEAGARKKWNEKACRSPRFERARRITRQALNTGAITRPSACEACGQVPKPMKDGRPSIQCHHLDYSKPMLIQWLCVPCHRAVTPKPTARSGITVSGERNSQSRLTDAQVRDIRRRYSEGDGSMSALGSEYGVNKSTICRVISRKAWNHV